MFRMSLSHRIAAAALVPLMLASCGGGGGQTPAPPVMAVPTPTPSPTPTPVPTPTPSTAVALQGPAAIAQVGEFAVLAHAVSFTIPPGGGDVRDVAESFDGTRFRYLASGVHELLLPMFEWSRLGTAMAMPGNAFSGQTVIEPGGVKSFLLSLLIPAASQLPMAHSGFGNWYLNRQVLTSSGRSLQISGKFAYGVATAPGQLPLSGGATYAGFGDFDGYGTTSPMQLSVNFATGIVSGQIAPTFNDGAGAIAGAGPFTFAGTLAAGATALLIDVPLNGGRTGKLEIQFTGPSGEELIFRLRGLDDPFGRGPHVSAVGVGTARRG